MSGTLNLLEAARDFGSDASSRQSTSEVYGTAITMPIDETHPLQGQSPYSASKIGADMMAEAFGALLRDAGRRSCGPSIPSGRARASAP